VFKNTALSCLNGYTVDRRRSYTADRQKRMSRVLSVSTPWRMCCQQWRHRHGNQVTQNTAFRRPFLGVEPFQFLQQMFETFAVKTSSATTIISVNQSTSNEMPPSILHDRTRPPVAPLHLGIRIGDINPPPRGHKHSRTTLIMKIFHHTMVATYNNIATNSNKVIIKKLLTIYTLIYTLVSWSYWQLIQ